MCMSWCYQKKHRKTGDDSIGEVEDETTQKQDLSIEKNIVSNKKITIKDFNLIALLGEGHYSKIFLAEYKENKKLYAIKIFERKQEKKIAAKIELETLIKYQA